MGHLTNPTSFRLGSVKHWGLLHSARLDLNYINLKEFFILRFFFSYLQKRIFIKMRYFAFRFKKLKGFWYDFLLLGFRYSVKKPKKHIIKKKPKKHKIRYRRRRFNLINILKKKKKKNIYN